MPRASLPTSHRPEPAKEDPAEPVVTPQDQAEVPKPKDFVPPQPAKRSWAPGDPASWEEAQILGQPGYF